MNFKVEDHGTVADMPDSCQQILVIYARDQGFAFALEHGFLDFLQNQDEETVAEIHAALLECLRRALNTARGVA